MNFTKMAEKAVHEHCPQDKTEERERREELWYRDVRRALQRQGVADKDGLFRAVAKDIAKAHRFVYEW